VAREVFDVSGAGDTVIATLAVMLAQRRRLGARRFMSPTSRPASSSANWVRRGYRAEELDAALN
jgi:sugar/nucleoside kinase (ribokinase family)